MGSVDALKRRKKNHSHVNLDNEKSDKRKIYG